MGSIPSNPSDSHVGWATPFKTLSDVNQRLTKFDHGGVLRLQKNIIGDTLSVRIVLLN